ncbi:MAG: hypothetical protein U9R06_02030 [Patescibacteria group bacterium]|nr:hypothetical protein [Patescibacteria group bacterium]
MAQIRTIENPEEEQNASSQLRQAKQKGRILNTAGKGAKGAGTAMQAGGATAQAAFKGTEFASKGVQAASKGGKAGGQAMMRAGAGLSSTGLGAIAGVPLAVVGGAVYGGSAVAGGVAKGTEAASKAGGKAAKATKKAGKKTKKIGSGLNIAAQLRADKMADMALRKAMPAPLKIGVKLGEMAGIDMMKWLKRSIILGFALYFLWYIGIILAIGGFIFVTKEIITEYPFQALREILSFLIKTIIPTK